MPDNVKVLAIAPFEDWTYGEAQKALQEALFEDYTIIEKYVNDNDHFQNGAEWIGPGNAVTNDKIEKQFAPEDLIGEVLTNIENAFSEPQIGSTPVLETGSTPEATKRKQAELHRILSNWWDKRKLQELVHKCQRDAAWAGWSGIRLWIPWRFLEVNDEGVVTIREAESVEEAMSFIFAMSPEPRYGGVFTHPGTQDKVAIFLDEEYVTVDGKQESYKRAEIMYLDPNRRKDEDADTILRVIYADDKRPGKTVRLPINGHLMFAEMRNNRVITDPVVRTQRQLNFVATLVGRISETAAFREHYTMNAKPQGIRYPYEDGDTLRTGAFIERDEEGRQWQVVPQARTLGAATTTELVGLPKQDVTGAPSGFETPQVFIADPVDPKPYIEAVDGIRRRGLRMCGQGHLGGISNAEASGIAYEQARSVFAKDLNKRRVSEEGMLRDLLTTAITLAELLANQVGYFTQDLRITVDQYVNPGPRSPDLVRLDLESYEAGVLSLITTMSKVGVEDTDAEQDRLRKSAMYIMAVLEKAASATGLVTPESLLSVMEQLGIPKDIQNKLVAPSEPEPVAPDPNVVQ